MTGTRLWLLLACGLFAGCAPGVPDDSVDTGYEATSPQYEPGDPCKGVVPQLCAY